MKLEKKVIGLQIVARVWAAILFVGGSVAAALFVPKPYLLLVLIPSVVLTIFVLIGTFLMPILWVPRYCFTYDEEKITIKEGVFFRRYTVIPVIQIQDISLVEGPLQLAFSVSTIVIATAGSHQSICFVHKEKARNMVDELQVKIKERMEKLGESL